MRTVRLASSSETSRTCSGSSSFAHLELILCQGCLSWAYELWDTEYGVCTVCLSILGRTRLGSRLSVHRGEGKISRARGLVQYGVGWHGGMAEQSVRQSVRPAGYGEQTNKQTPESQPGRQVKRRNGRQASKAGKQADCWLSARSASICHVLSRHIASLD